MKKANRYLVAFVSAVIATIVAGSLMLLEVPARPVAQQAAPARPHGSSGEDLAVFEVCVVFYLVMYTAGDIIYRVLGADDDRRDLKRLSGAHLVLLHLMAGLFLVCTPWAQPAGNNRGALASWVMVLIGAAVICRELLQFFRYRRSEVERQRAEG